MLLIVHMGFRSWLYHFFHVYLYKLLHLCASVSFFVKWDSC